ncbi:hypothetical protein N4R57_07810 [Rhodobacteraceae bacterium D3-12]|nr:hypothetical protein N4R57_07810 [Rhodobacteraceae bacterium D3-12]
MKTLFITLATFGALGFLGAAMLHLSLDSPPLTRQLGFAPDIAVTPLAPAPVRQN